MYRTPKSIARAAADNERYQPGTNAFNAKPGNVRHMNNCDIGSALIMNTGFIHAEGQYDWSPYITTPKWITKFSVGNRELLKDTKFNITCRWKGAFYWQTSLADGRIAAFRVVMYR